MLQPKPLAMQITPFIQRQSVEEEEEELLQPKVMGSYQSAVQCQPLEEEEEIQTKSKEGQQPQASIPFLQSHIQSLKGGGRSLSQPERSFFESRFSCDFSEVRIHNNNMAAESAKTLNAKAYTHGKNIVFGTGEYSPASNAGQKLLAHELTHVVQQEGRMPSHPVIQRRVQVNPGATAVNDILNQFRFLCPGSWMNSGQRITGHANSTASESCLCLEDTVNHPGRTFTINVDAISNTPRNETLHDGTAAALPYPSSGPRTYNGPNPTIHTAASTGAAIEFGAFETSGRAMQVPNWRILAHELCGHARLNQSYTQGPPDYGKGNRPEHNSTINTENTIAAEHGGARRGQFNDPRQGESYHNQRNNRGRIVFKLVDGWHYEPPTPIPLLPITGTIHGRITASALRIRQGPNTSSPILGLYPRGAIIIITCQTSGTNIAGNSLWNKTDRGYVSDRYVDRIRPMFVKLPTC